MKRGQATTKAKKEKKKAIYKKIWVPKWTGPTPTIDKTIVTNGVSDSSPLFSAKTSSTKVTPPYHCPVKSRLAPLLPSPKLTLLSLAISYYDLTTFFVALSKKSLQQVITNQKGKSVTSVLPEVVEQNIPKSLEDFKGKGQISTCNEDADWVKVLPKPMRGLQRDSSPRNISQFIHKRLRYLSVAGKCFKCHVKGHLSNACTDEYRCIGCERKGHFLIDCPMLRDHIVSDSKDSFSVINPTTVYKLSNDSPPPPSSTIGNPSCRNPSSMAQPPPPVILENPTENSWAAMHPIHPLPQPNFNNNWENAHFPPATEFKGFRPDMADIYLPPLNLPSGFHARDIPKAIHLTFQDGFPMEGDISHVLSTRLAQRFGGRHSDYRVAMLDDIGTQYIVVVRNGNFRNQMCRAPTFQLITPSYEGPIVLRPWTRASGGFIERPTHYLKVRLQGVPLHLWREGLIQYLCSSFGTVLSIGDLSGFRSFRVLLMGKHPALVPRELMMSQDPTVKFADIVLEGWAPLFQPPHNVQLVGSAMPWIPPYQPP